MAWVLTKNLVRLTEECNILGPDRDKSSDGSVGDLAHQGGKSGHNPDKTGNAEYKDGDSKDEVRAKDIDKSGPWRYGQTMEKIVQHLVKEARAAYAAGRYYPLQYIIFNGRIWSKTDGWKTHTYTGRNKHDQHAHFSGGRSQRADEDRNYNYGIATLGKPEEEPSMGFIDNQTEFNAAFNTAMNNYLKATANQQTLADAILSSKVGNGAYAGRTVRNFLNDLWGVRDVLVGDEKGADSKMSHVTPATPMFKSLAVAPVLVEFITDESARDAADAARDAAILASINGLASLMAQATGTQLTTEQFNELKRLVGEKIVEAGEDAIQETGNRLARLGEALDNAGEALTADNDGGATQ